MASLDFVNVVSLDVLLKVEFVPFDLTVRTELALCILLLTILVLDSFSRRLYGLVFLADGSAGGEKIIEPLIGVEKPEAGEFTKEVAGEAA